MFAVQTLIVATLLTQLVLVVASSTKGSPPEDSITEAQRPDLYGANVTHVVKFTRPLGNLQKEHGIICHSGIVVTLEGLNMKLLIHKLVSGMTVQDADSMGTEWTTAGLMEGQEKDSAKGKTVADLVKIGGPFYNIFFANCHQGTNKMFNNLRRTMKQK